MTTTLPPLPALPALPELLSAKLRHAYELLKAGHCGDPETFADGLIAPVIRGLEAIAAQAQPAPITPTNDQFLELLGEYWDLAFAEGKEGRLHDNEAGDANRVHAKLREMFAAPAVLAVQPTPPGVPLLVVGGLAHFFELNGKLDEPVMEACRRLGDLVMPTATLLDDEAARKTILDAVNFVIEHGISAPVVPTPKDAA